MKKPTNHLPAAPSGLSTEAGQWWASIVRDYALEPSALLILENALSSFDTMRAAQALIKKDGLVSVDRFGQAKAHPATLIERDSKATMLRHLQQLGLDLEPLHAGPGRPPAGGR